MAWRLWRVVLVLLMAASGVAALAWFGFERGWWRANYPDPARHPNVGVDVSHHQGKIDWPTLAAAPHITFAYIKATEGGDFVDPQFADNWREARRAGVRTGAYHFFTFCRPAAEQARHFIATVPREADALPPAVDVELGGNCGGSHDYASLRAGLRLWLKLVEQHFGKRPIIYVTREAYELFVEGEPVYWPIWIRSILKSPDDVHFRVWQFANRGRLPGIDGPVDLNVFAGALPSPWR